MIELKKHNNIWILSIEEKFAFEEKDFDAVGKVFHELLKLKKERGNLHELQKKNMEKRFELDASNFSTTLKAIASIVEGDPKKAGLVFKTIKKEL